MNAMKNKIKSRRGASITFALLLFLVCSVLSGIIIVAATTASGRMDQIAESDQRYYAVTSAAELLKDELDGKCVTVEFYEKTETTVTHSETSETQGEPTVKENYVRLWYDDNESNYTSLASAENVEALSVLGEFSYWVADDQYKDETSTHLINGVTSPISSVDLSLSADGDITDAVSVEMRSKSPSSGIIDFYISKIDPKDKTGKKAYTLRLSFKADVKTTKDEKTTMGSPKNINIEKKTYDVDKIKETTVKTTMTWSLTDIVKSTMPNA